MRLEEQVSRRFEIKTLGAGVASLFIPLQDKPVPAQVISVVQEIREREDFFGNSALSFEDARDLVPLYARFRKVTEGLVNSEGSDIASRVYVIRKDSEDPAEQLRVDYSSTNFSQRELDTARQWTSTIGGWSGLGKIFVVLDNNPGHQYPPNQVVYHWQYRNEGPKTPCTEATPVVNLRSKLLHEIEHDQAQAGVNWKKASPRLTEALKKRYPNGNLFEVRNFAVRINGNNFLPIFDEITTDRVSSRRSMAHRLEYTLRNLTPAYAADFTTKLRRAGISDQQIFTFYRQSRLEEFYIKAGGGDINRGLAMFPPDRIMLTANGIVYVDRSLTPRAPGIDGCV